jgi:NAD+ synthase
VAVTELSHRKSISHNVDGFAALQRTELNLSEVKRRATHFIKKKVEESQTDGVLVALDGEVESAVTAYLCVEALGSRRVMGLIMPDLRNVADGDMRDSEMVANELCLETKQFDIAPIHKAFMKTLQSNKVAEENLAARIRMSILYYQANLLNRLVAGTADRSEILLGHFTKYGGGGVDILPIGDLYKTEVRKLAEVLGINRCIVAKKRNSKLWSSHRRADAGLDYDTTDQILMLRFDHGLDPSEISAMVKKSQVRVEGVIARHDSSVHKRTKPEICPMR